VGVVHANVIIQPSRVSHRSQTRSSLAAEPWPQPRYDPDSQTTPTLVANARILLHLPPGPPAPPGKSLSEADTTPFTRVPIISPLLFSRTQAESSNLLGQRVPRHSKSCPVSPPVLPAFPRPDPSAGPRSLRLLIHRMYPSGPDTL
jgi:hypothetical protein